MEGVIANSFPKSGTHILTRILELLGYQSANTHLSRSLVMYGPRNIIRNINILRRVDQNGLRVDIENDSKRIKASWLDGHIQSHLRSKSYTQAHLPFSTELEELIFRTGVKSLYIHRDPKDVLVSLKNYILKLKHHPNHKMMLRCKTDEERFALLLKGYDESNNITQMAPFMKKYANSQKWLSSNHCCCVSYERIIGHQGGGTDQEQMEELKRTLVYLGVPLDKAEEIKGKIFNRESATFHKGKTEQWKTEFSQTTLDLFNKKQQELDLQ